MEEATKTDELAHWFSTYGIITAERLLGHYKISLPQIDLIDAIKVPTSFYRVLLQVSLQHVLNGIVMQQANDYHIYCQKLFIDYLLSGESGKSPEEQGGSTREALEEERQELVKLGEDFNKLEIQHDNLIASSQSFLIEYTKEWNALFESTLDSIHLTYKKDRSDITKELVRKAMNYALTHSGIAKSQNEVDVERFIDCLTTVSKVTLDDTKKKKIISQLNDLINYMSKMEAQLEEYIIATEQDGVKARDFRKQFYDAILRVSELIKLLSDYKIDPIQDAINREPLYFDRNLGGV
ncbi:hypothetical protein [Legionella waltersii]|uniref:Uncharacterized protein n=1 Tax=Legionella waltersii TaxID=66969 RepID=A0A0W1A102_9GAMM|nr:hypothetical protein [Legionella waltersii]KTD75047.1 hypothetical protein Lwal_3088 [Legionella waltersii]SNV05382.1 Uncharacterised protein [Legionella waltersii]